MSKGKKLFESEDFDKQKKLFTPDDFDKQRESTDSTGSYNNGSNEEDNSPTGAGKTNGGKIIIGIVAAAAILIGIYFFAIKDNGGDINVGSTAERVAQTEEATESGNSEIADETNANAESATTNAETPKPSDVNKTPTATEEGNVPTTAKVDEKKADRHSANETPSAQPAKPSLPKQTTTTSQEFSTPINDDVEENARRVIRGDFGNGQTRKDKLGSSYSEIQGRVNEIYRQGLVH